MSYVSDLSYNYTERMWFGVIKCFFGTSGNKGENC